MKSPMEDATPSILRGRTLCPRCLCGPLFSVFLSLLLSITGCGRGGRETEVRPPRLVFDETSYDFGRLEQGAAAEHRFRFRNEGDLELTIDQLRSGCACTAALRTPRAVPPHGSGEILAQLDTTNLAGAQRATTTVYSNDPARRTTVLTLAAEIAAVVVIDPPQLYLGPVARGARVASAATVLASNERVHIGPIIAHAPQFTVQPRDLVDGRRGKTFDIVIAADAPLGPFEQAVEVYATSGAPLLRRMPVAGSVLPDVTVSPPRLTLDIPAGGKPGVRQLLIENRGTAPVRITGVEWDAHLGSAELDILREGFRYRVRAVPHDPLPAGPPAGALRVMTDHADHPVIEVPIEWRVAAGTGAGAASAGQSEARRDTP